MRDTAYKMTAFTAIVSAAGFLLRWLQNMRIYEEDTGLALRGMGISYILAGTIVLTALVFGIAALRVRRCGADREPAEALGGRTFVFTAVWAAAVLLLAAAGVLQLLQANAENYPAGEIVIRRIAGGGAVAAAMALAVLMTGLSSPEKAGARRWCAGILVLFSCLWLVAAYKAASSDPVLWRSGVEILACCGAMMAFYHVAGYFFGQPNPSACVFFCDLGAFLCVMSAIDDRPAAEGFCFAAVALVLLIWSYSILANLRPEKEPEPEA